MKVVREEPKPLDESYLERLAEEYKKSKELQEQVEKRTNAIKKELSEAVETHGTPDDKGHLWLKVGEASLIGLAWKDESLAEKVREFYTEKETWAFKA